MEKKKQLEELNQPDQLEEKTKTQIKEEKRKEKEKRELEKKVRVQRQNIEKEIMEIEEKIEELDNLMCDEEIYSNPDKSREVNQTKCEFEKKLEQLYEKWEELI